MPEELTAKGKLPETLTRASLLSLAKPAGPSPFNEKSQFDAVFAGGYYVIYTDAELAAAMPRNVRVQQKRNRKNEESLALANLAHQIIDNLKQTQAESKSSPAENAGKENPAPHATRHEKLLEDIQTLIAKSDMVSTAHEQHLRDELGIARQQLLRGGAIDDFALMQTLQEIAEIQGISLGSSSMAGRFSSDIIDPPEPQAETPREQVTATQVAPSATAGSIFDRDREEYLQREFEQFSAYDIEAVGGIGHASFFAKKVMDGLIEIDTSTEQEQNQKEISAP